MIVRLLLLPALLFLLPQFTNAAVFRFDVTLDGTQSGTGSPGTGSATAFLDDTSGLFELTGMFAGLNGTSTNAHLHGPTAAPGTGNAGVLTGLTFDAGVQAGSFMGNAMFNSTQIAATLNEQTYINIHSSTDGGGEIRGFLLSPTAVPEPGTFALMSVVAMGMMARRRRRSC